MRFLKGGPIRVGDSTTGGGKVIGPGAAVMPIYDFPAVLRGDAAVCCGSVQTFLEGCLSVDFHGRGLVIEGHKLSCGHHAISSCAVTDWITDHAPAGMPEALVRSRSEPVLDTGLLEPDSATQLQDDVAESPTKVAVTLRIGVFFDGTNNNAANTALGQQCRASTGSALGQDEVDQQAIAAHCKPYMREAGSSYGNGVTNVHRLYELYRDSQA